jgi:hypothetical protein
MKEFLKTYESGKALSKRRTSPVLEVRSMKNSLQKTKENQAWQISYKKIWMGKQKPKNKSY